MASKKFVRTSEQMRGLEAGAVAIVRAQMPGVGLEIEGDALLQNNFSQKILEQMLRKHMGITVEREKKVPADIVENAIVRNTDGRVCIPPIGIKKAMLTAAKLVKLQKTSLRAQIFVEGKSLPITYESMVPRMDMVRLAGMARTPDIRFRPCFEHWKCRLIVRFSDTIQVQTVVDLLDRAGNVGVGEWRPEKDGTFGTFHVCRHISDAKELAQVQCECAVPLKGLEIPAWALNAELSPEILARVAAGEGEGESVEESEKDD